MVSLASVTTPQDLRDFIDLPPQVYGNLANYEPPLRLDRDLLLNPGKKNIFWDQSRVRYWLARIDSRPVGRISAQIGAKLPRGIAPNSGMFGCLDAIDDREVIEMLLSAAREWLAAEGCTSMFGPCTLDMNDEPGLLVDGADQEPMTLSPWHPPYLGSLLEQVGLTRLRDLHSWRLDLASSPPTADSGRLRLAERIPGLRIRHPDRKSYARDIQTLCDIYNDGWQGNWGFVPLTPEDLDGLDQLMKWFVPREAFKIIELAGKPVAVVLLIPNLFELTQGLAPSPGPFGWAKILWRACTHQFRSGRIIITGIAQNLQGTVTGSAIAALLVDELIAGHAVLKGEWVEAGWVLEDNRALIQILERFHFRRNKTFRLYSQAFKPEPLLT
jgi:hypothetical protein